MYTRSHIKRGVFKRLDQPERSGWGLREAAVPAQLTHLLGRRAPFQPLRLELEDDLADPALHRVQVCVFGAVVLKVHVQDKLGALLLEAGAARGQVVPFAFGGLVRVDVLLAQAGLVRVVIWS